MTRTFALYPEERHWWSFNDYGHVLDTVRALGAKRILEFGPGSSTLALIEGGATTIDTCEDQPDWAEVYEERLAGKYPGVRVHRFTLAPALSIPAIDAERYDLALIDGPRSTERRGPAIRYALARCAAVLLPTEDRNRHFRGEIQAIADELGWAMVVTDTGPLSGGFALLTPKAQAVEAPEPAGEPDEAPASVQPEEIDHQDPPTLVTRPAAPTSRRARRRAAKKTGGPTP
jgi:hypothetical protein